MKAKSAISAKIFFRKTVYGLCIEIHNSVYFWRRHNSYDRILQLMKNSYPDTKTDIASLLCQDEIQTSSNRAKTWSKDFELGDPKYNTLGFKYMGEV